jgi:hypothetical protein
VRNGTKSELASCQIKRGKGPGLESAQNWHSFLGLKPQVPSEICDSQLQGMERCADFGEKREADDDAAGGWRNGKRGRVAG